MRITGGGPESEHDHPTRYPWYQPADPAWAPRDNVNRVRDALKRLNSRLSLWWVPGWKAEDKERPGRWAVVWYMHRARSWSVVFYIETVGGGYQEVTTDLIPRLLEQLELCDTEKAGRSHKDRERMEREQKEIADKAANKDVLEIVTESALDMAARKFRGKFTVGPGSKGSSSAGKEARDPAFAKLVKERGLE